MKLMRSRPRKIHSMHDLRLAKHLTYQRLIHLEERMEHHGDAFRHQLSWRNLSFETGEWISRQSARLSSGSSNGHAQSTDLAPSEERSSWLQHLLPFVAGALTAVLRNVYEQQVEEPAPEAAPVSS